LGADQHAGPPGAGARGSSLIQWFPGHMHSTRKAIAEREIHSLGVLLKVGATVGGTMWREEDDVASIVARADEYLYAAKVAGRNRVGWQGDILED